jgi:hypothetical protein
VSQEIKTGAAARAAAARRRHANGGEPDSPFWQPPWYQPATARDSNDKAGDESE